MTRIQLRITEHATLRYLERVKGIDVEAVRRELEQKVRAAHKAGASGVIVDGMEFVLSSDALVTVTPKKTRPPRPVRLHDQADDWGRD